MSPVRIRNFTALNCEKRRSVNASGYKWLATNQDLQGWGKQGHASDDDDHNVDVDVNKER